MISKLITQQELELIFNDSRKYLSFYSVLINCNDFYGKKKSGIMYEIYTVTFSVN